MKTSSVTFPEKSAESSSVLQDIDHLLENDSSWKTGKMFGYVFNPGDEMVTFLEKAYLKCAHMNRMGGHPAFHERGRISGSDI